MQRLFFCVRIDLFFVLLYHRATLEQFRESEVCVFIEDLAISESTAFYSQLSVLENIVLGLRGMGISNSDRDFLPLSSCSDRLWDPLSLYPAGTVGSAPQGEVARARS
jgi:hypothetical protein